MRLDQIRNQDMSGIFCRSPPCEQRFRRCGIPYNPHRAFPSACCCLQQLVTPSTFAVTPLPLISSTSVTRLGSRGFPYAFLQALADRMGGMAFRQRCIFQQLLCHPLDRMMHTAYFEHALRHGSCLIKYNIFGFGQVFPDSWSLLPEHLRCWHRRFRQRNSEEY